MFVTIRLQKRKKNVKWVLYKYISVFLTDLNMYDYNNSLRDNFRLSINRVNKNDTNTSSPASTNSAAAGTMPAVTPDYNVVLPVGYTKIGVEKLSNGQEIHCYKLNNGQRVYIAPKESAMTTLNTYVNTGSMNEKDSERGISHFCEHMAFNGTKGTDNYMKLGIGDVFRKVNKMGGRTNASTGFAETNYTISIPQFNKEDFETIVKMQSSMMNNLEMSDEMVEKEHGPVTSEINMYADMPDTIVQNTAIKNLYNIQTTSDDVVAGTVDNILNINRDKVTEYFKNNYYPANMSTVVTGDVNPDEAIEIIAKNFRGQNPPAPDRRFEQLNPIEKTVRKDIISSKAVGTTGVVCFNGPAFNNIKDSVAVSVLNRYLYNKDNSKTDMQLKDYNVSVHAMSDKFSANANDGRLITVMYNSTEENSEIALRNIFSNLANFKAPTPKEMENLKSEIKMISEKSNEDMESLNYEIGACVSTGGIDNLTKEMEILDSLTPQDLVDVVHKYYDINKASVAVIHPETSNIQDLSANHAKAKSVSFTGTHEPKKKQPVKLSEINQYKLNNNFEVAMFESKNDISNFSVCIGTNVPPNTKPGVISLLSKMLENKTANYTDFMDDNTIRVNVDSTENSLIFDAEVPAKNLNASLNLMKELLMNPDFSEKNFEQAKQDIKNTLSITQPNAIDNSLNDVFPDSPRGYTNKDVLDNIDKIQLGDVIGLYSYIKDNSSAICSASLPTGKYPESKTVLDNQLRTLPMFKPLNVRNFNDFKPIERSKVVRDGANTAQAEIVETFKFYNDHSPKSKVVNFMVNSILSSGDETGLFNNLREKQKLAYSVHSFCEPSKYSSSTLTCCILTTTDAPDYKSYENVQKSIDGFNTQIGKMVNGEFTDEEIETAKINLKRILLEQNNLQEDKVLNMSDMLLSSKNGISEFNEMYDIVDSITKDDIVNGAKHIFSQKPIYSIRASQDTLDANREYLDGLEG